MCFTSTMMAFLLLLAFSLIVTLSSGADTISANQSISGNQTIISKYDSFELGFFQPGRSSNYYIGMWYRKASKVQQTIVWVANRETPVSDPFSCKLKIIDGNLVLLNESKSQIWSTGISYSDSNSVIAVLLDDGNLVLRTGLNLNKNIWQSFDFPSHLWLPGAKLGYNNITKRKTLLTSWKSIDDPAEGLYSLELDPFNKQLLIKWNRSIVYWTSGYWNETDKLFSFNPEMRLLNIYNYSYVSNENEMYFTYTLINPSVITNFIMEVSGHFTQLSWLDATQQWNWFFSQPRTQCEVYYYCGAFGLCRESGLPICICLPGFSPKSPTDWDQNDFSGGCVRKTDLQCWRTSVEYRFLRIPSSRRVWPPGSSAFAVGSFKDCESSCLTNCTCSAYSYNNKVCWLWNVQLVDLYEHNGNETTINVKVALKDLQSEKKNNGKTKRGVIVGRVVGSFIGFVLLMGLIWCLINRNRRFIGTAVAGRPKKTLDKCDKGSNSQMGSAEVPLFSLAKINKATNDFSVENKLGEGGFGSVYKGVLEGQEIAVKRLSKSSQQGIDEFENEVVCIAKLQHRNLVKLLGYCIQDDEKMLIYEYMPNKSLDSFLFDKSRKSLLIWPQRFQIIHGIARGLLYLHQDSRLKVVHRDLKAGNILLDHQMRPKISDFGLARMFKEEENEANTKRVVGTLGYISPEYAVNGLYSIKSDIFSFGVLVLEIVSGKKNKCFVYEDHEDNLLGHAWRLYKKGKSLDLIDECLHTSYSSCEVLRSIHVGLLCVQQRVEDRPDTPAVVGMLSGEGSLPSPKKPAFYIQESEINSTSILPLLSSSVNGVTLSQVDGR